MTVGLTFPFVTDLDPDRAGEGSLDPLGLARLADRLADEIAPEVTARMSRIRFVTAIAACSQLLGEPADMLSKDGTPAYLAFEWHVVESFVRVSPASGTDAVPGIQKARARLRDRRRHLNGPSYLETPKVFGFHGVYKRIARDMEVADENLVLLPRGDELVATWEREQQLDGFARRLSRARGGRLALQLKGQVGRALDNGGVELGYSSQWWPVISGAFGPGDAGGRERRQLWGWLVDPRWEVRREIALLIARDRDSSTDERGAVERLLAESLSAELRNRLRAIDGFEAAVRPLDDGFRLLRSIATQRIPSAVAAADAAKNPAMRQVAQSLSAAIRSAGERLEEVGLAAEFEAELGQFAEHLPADQLVEAILDRHDEVQGRKGKRAWFERDETGFAVRGIGRLDDPFVPRTAYLHPYRIFALRSFARDLRPTVTR
jgi:hypothetical protein